MKFAALLLLSALLGCGEVTAGPVDGGGGAPGTGGTAGQAAGSASGTGGAGGAAGGASGTGGAGGAADCVSPSATGFAINTPCGGGPPAAYACYAACTLSGASYVGCVQPYSNPIIPSRCYASCAECP